MNETIKTEKKREKIKLCWVWWHLKSIHDNRKWHHMPLKERARVLFKLFEEELACD